jgi:hypothetical protein
MPSRTPNGAKAIQRGCGADWRAAGPHRDLSYPLFGAPHLKVTVMSKTAIPHNLRDWSAWAIRLSTARLYFKDDFKTAAGSLSEGTVIELGQFYERAVHENHVIKVNEWLRSISEQGAMSDVERGIRNLVLLFAHIARHWGLAPFITYALKAERLIAPKPDWTKLPHGFEFIAEPAVWACRFTYVFSDAGQDAVRASVGQRELEVLKDTAGKIRSAGSDRIRAWRIKLGVDEHVEASMVFNLLAVMDALELRYYE